MSMLCPVSMYVWFVSYNPRDGATSQCIIVNILIYGLFSQIFQWFLPCSLASGNFIVNTLSHSLSLQHSFNGVTTRSFRALHTDAFALPGGAETGSFVCGEKLSLPKAGTYMYVIVL